MSWIGRILGQQLLYIVSLKVEYMSYVGNTFQFFLSMYGTHIYMA